MVKGADMWENRGSGKLTEEVKKTLLHFFCGFIGEGDGKDVFGQDVHIMNQPRDMMGESFSFTTAGAREDEDRPLGGFDRAELFRIEVSFQDIHKVCEMRRELTCAIVA